eukprot:4284367-Amphidinium_carterae.1
MGLESQPNKSDMQGHPKTIAIQQIGYQTLKVTEGTWIKCKTSCGPAQLYPSEPNAVSKESYTVVKLALLNSFSGN